MKGLFHPEVNTGTVAVSDINPGDFQFRRSGLLRIIWKTKYVYLSILVFLICLLKIPTLMTINEGNFGEK